MKHLIFKINFQFQKTQQATNELFFFQASSSERTNITTLARNGFRQVSSLFNYISPNHDFDDIEWLQEVDKSISLPGSINVLVEGSVSYFIKNSSGVPIALFKPDLEPFEDASQNEIAARIVGNDFCGVPKIQQVKIVINGMLKKGSLQKFVPNEGTFASYLQKNIGVNQNLNNLSPRQMWRSQRMSVSHVFDLFDKVGTEIHKMGILDLLIQNDDRANPFNILISGTDQNIKLIPIDHNLTFPIQINPLTILPWMGSPFSIEPFDKATLEFINNLNIKRISLQLERIGLNSEKIKSFKIMAMLVKKGAAAKLTLLEIAFMTIYKRSLGDSSEFIDIVERVNKSLVDLNNENEFFDKLSDELDKVFLEKRKEKSAQGFTKNLNYYIPLLQRETYESFDRWKEATEIDGF